MSMEKRSQNKWAIADAAQTYGMAVDEAPYGIAEEEWVRVYGEIGGKNVDVIISADTRLIQGTADGVAFDEEDVLNREPWFVFITGIANGEGLSGPVNTTDGHVA